eukprot:GILK01009824.1.p1 GENE.GILK01009824.1~~GILK01009824.1.p1  ORF type:complete len:113 (-),score=17.91 GILK01009824.1:180-470(-)
MTELKPSGMDDAVIAQLDKIAAQAGVTGVVAVGAQGLCLGARGTGSSKTAGLISMLASDAEALSNGEAPLLSVETESQRIVIKRQGDITLAIHKSV